MAPQQQFGSSVGAALATMQPKQQEAPAPAPSLKSSLGTVLGNSGVLGKIVAASAAEGPRKIELYSNEYYWTCAAGGVMSCGLTHMGVTPLDVVKCNLQTNPAKYKGIKQGFSMVVSEAGMAGLFKGWVPTLIGYSAQGACKFGLYEYFKKTYTDMAGEELAKKYQSAIFLAGSASAEFFADIALCPFEAVKVKVQTVPGFAKGLSDGFPKVIAAEGVSG
ncbi:Phosphate carrier protein, mitochondrial [Tetrabaena socialis]|uniref:Phosphate carrier protein, mitochondrial n=1 Tax=Tetrabaena socialis TaxID=47790 RepID=A0A2J7ZHM0_9CHLO|nr:Phosphate carrier protein, mitochondrial [Tetrabaena socialis]|eukprot:PNG99729.1 Phosphate carrier protein, mitochondrial [Tetrabaena socialis]